MIEHSHEDVVNSFEDGMKHCYRKVKLIIPIPTLKDIVNEGLPEGTIDAEDFAGRQSNVRVFDDHIEMDVDYWYSTAALSEERLQFTKEIAKEKIRIVQQTLQMLCDNMDITMDDLQESLREIK